MRQISKVGKKGKGKEQTENFQQAPEGLFDLESEFKVTKATFKRPLQSKPQTKETTKRSAYGIGSQVGSQILNHSSPLKESSLNLPFPEDFDKHERFLEEEFTITKQLFK